MTRLLQMPRRPGLRWLFMAIIICIVLPGCVGGCFQIPTATHTVTLKKDVPLPGMGPGGLELNNLVLNLPDVCGLPTEEEIAQKLGQYLGGCVASRAKVARLLLRHIAFDASEGNFSTLTKVSITLVAGETEIDLGTVESENGLDKSFKLIPETPIDLADALFNQSEGGCVNLRFAVSGRVPAEDVLFDIRAELGVTFSI